MASLTFLSTLFGSVGIIAQRPTAWKRDLWGWAQTLGYNPPLDPMSLIAAADLAKSYGAQDVFAGLTFAIPHQARIALVGPNGVGKTTLLRLLAGEETPDRGRMQRARKLRVGYLPQTLQEELALGEQGLEQRLWEFALQAFVELRRQEAELTRLEARMADPRHAEEALARYGTLQEAFERAGGYLYAATTRRVLAGLGFQPEDFERPLRELSGGQRTRAFLARLLLEDPDLLLLDEPTNFLEVQAVEWLEGWLPEWPGAAVVVSHDRYFLDRTAEVVWELGPRGLEAYRGNYTAYTRQRAERRELQWAKYRAQQEHIAKEQEYIRRNIAGQNTRQAQGRRKRLERLLRDHAVERPQEGRDLALDFQVERRSGDRVLETRGLVVGYPGEEALFVVPDLVLERGERAAILGPNGAGKTTLLKTLLGEVPPQAGSVRLGAGLKVGYFEQTQAGLVGDHSVLQEILQAAPSLRVSEARHLLARFLFRGDEVEKAVEALSGGERVRLVLAKLALQRANLLLLDEPTTHLDIPAQEVLQEAIRSFPGTVLLVTHDRYLVDALATQVWDISRQERRLTVHQGGYSEYLEERRRREAHARSGTEASQADRRRDPARQARQKQRRARVELQALEARIESLERELEKVGAELNTAGGDAERVRELGGRYATLETELQRQLETWEALARDAEGSPPAPGSAQA